MKMKEGLVKNKPYKMMRLRISTAIAILSFPLWFIALMLPAFLSFGEGSETSGLVVLLFWWLGPLEGHFGWYANVLWFVAFFTLVFDDKRCVSSASLAAIVALDTFFVGQIPGPALGDNQPVYGLGIGATIWLTAIVLTLIAAAFREKESTGETGFLWFSSVFSAGLIGLIVALSIHDRVVGNESERNRLNRDLVAFKRSTMCNLALNAIPGCRTPP